MEQYTNPRSVGSLGGMKRLQSSLPSYRSWHEVQAFLQKNDAYTLHRKKVRKFRRNKYILKGIDDLWQSDLADLTGLSHYNDNYKYLLVTIDCFSKYLWVTPLRSKTAQAVLDAVKEMKTMRKPKNWQTDKGGEFRALQDFMKEHGVNFYTTQNPDTKAAIAERVIRTLKSRLYRYFTAKNTYKYLDVLQDIVHSYNNSKHRTTGMKPTEVTRNDVKKIKQKMYPPEVNLEVKFKYRVGDSVRLAKEKYIFEKGYKQGWTDEIFEIVERVPRDPPVYKVKDLSGETIVGTFYEQELQKVIKTDNTYKIESILKHRTSNGKKEYLVKWLGYPDSFASWVAAEDITTT